MIAIVKISFVLCPRIDREVEEFGGLVLPVDFHVESLSAVEVLPFPLANGGCRSWAGSPDDMRDSEGRPPKCEFPPAQTYQWVSQESVCWKLRELR